MSKEEELDELLTEIDLANQADIAAKKSLTRKLFNQPTLLTLSSVNTLQQGQSVSYGEDSAFYNFTVNLDRPALDVESLQLLQTNIPQCNANIPNTASVFWYYRLSLYSGSIPSLNNLYFARLLPSFYKPEFITNATQYGFNKTFASYPKLATELDKSVTTDLAVNNYAIWQKAYPDVSARNPDLYRRMYIPFIPNDISLPYNSDLNKFQMTGNNNNVAYVAYNDTVEYRVDDIVYYSPPAWSATMALYQVGDLVVYIDRTYRCKVALNYNYPPNLNPYYWDLFSFEYLNLPYKALSTNVGVLPISGTPTIPAVWERLYIDVIQPYSATTPYRTGQYVSQGGVIYQVKPYFDPTPPGTYSDTVIYNIAPNDEDVDWKLLSADDVAKTQWYNYLSTGYNDPNVNILQGDLTSVKWNPTTLYEINEYVEYQPTGVTWSPGVEYREATYVTYNSNVYLSYIPTYNLSPESTIPEWQNNNYQQYSVVTYLGSTYFANTYIQKGRGAPDINGRWTLSNPINTIDSIWRIQTAKTYVSINQNLNATPISCGQEWDGSSFSLGDIVNYSGYVYMSRSNNNEGNEPIEGQNSGYWTVITTIGWFNAEPEYTLNTGLFGITKKFDYMEYINSFNSQLNIVTTYWQTNFPIGAGQPYRENPSRIFNTILGFTWNGVFDPDNFKFLLSNSINPNNPIYPGSPQLSSTYARLRPVPFILITSTTLLGDALVSNTYTADGYCNMVYSSIISIYTNVVGGSSLDTQRNTNLLAITSMNCGNLGVAFWSNYVDNPLFQVNDDIRTIYIEFRDEFGDPYYLTNNAVATLSLKIHYKKITG